MCHCWWQAEVAKLEAGGTARPEDAAAMLERVLAEGSRSNATSGNHSGRQNGAAEAAGPLYSAAMQLARQEVERVKRQQLGAEQQVHVTMMAGTGQPSEQQQQPPPPLQPAKPEAVP